MVRLRHDDHGKRMKSSVTEVVRHHLDYGKKNQETISKDNH